MPSYFGSSNISDKKSLIENLLKGSINDLKNIDVITDDVIKNTCINCVKKLCKSIGAGAIEAAEHYNDFIKRNIQNQLQGKNLDRVTLDYKNFDFIQGGDNPRINPLYRGIIQSIPADDIKSFKDSALDCYNRNKNVPGLHNSIGNYKILKDITGTRSFLQVLLDIISFKWIWGQDTFAIQGKQKILNVAQEIGANIENSLEDDERIYVLAIGGAEVSISKEADEFGFYDVEYKPDNENEIQKDIPQEKIQEQNNDEPEFEVGGPRDNLVIIPEEDLENIINNNSKNNDENELEDNNFNLIKDNSVKKEEVIDKQEVVNDKDVDDNFNILNENYKEDNYNKIDTILSISNKYKSAEKAQNMLLLDKNSANEAKKAIKELGGDEDIFYLNLEDTKRILLQRTQGMEVVDFDYKYYDDILNWKNLKNNYNDVKKKYQVIEQMGQIYFDHQKSDISEGRTALQMKELDGEYMLGFHVWSEFGFKIKDQNNVKNEYIVHLTNKLNMPESFDKFKEEYDNKLAPFKDSIKKNLKLLFPKKEEADYDYAYNNIINNYDIIDKLDKMRKDSLSNQNRNNLDKNTINNIIINSLQNIDIEFKDTIEHITTKKMEIRDYNDKIINNREQISIDNMDPVDYTFVDNNVNEISGRVVTKKDAPQSIIINDYVDNAKSGQARLNVDVNGLKDRIKLSKEKQLSESELVSIEDDLKKLGVDPLVINIPNPDYINKFIDRELGIVEKGFDYSSFDSIFEYITTSQVIKSNIISNVSLHGTYIAKHEIEPNFVNIELAKNIVETFKNVVDIKQNLNFGVIEEENDKNLHKLLGVERIKNFDGVRNEFDVIVTKFNKETGEIERIDNNNSIDEPQMVK